MEQIVVSKEEYADKLGDGIYCPNCLFFDTKYETCEHKNNWREVIWSAECDEFLFKYVTQKPQRWLPAGTHPRE